MATLNVKNLPDPLYKKLRARARRLRRSIAQEVTLILEDALERERPLSLLALKGLGKDVWSGESAVAHVEAERRSWD